MSLTNSIKTIQDIMRKNVGLAGDAQRIAQLVWMLFLKVLDEQEKMRERSDRVYTSPIKEKYRWRNRTLCEEYNTFNEDRKLEKEIQSLRGLLKNELAAVLEL